MTLPIDEHERLAEYAHPGRLVTTDWVQEHLGDERLVIVESDEDVLLYEAGHIPGAVKLDWHVDLNDPVTRDFIDGERFAELMRERGIRRDHTVVIYGDKSNWWAAYALWLMTLFGHEDVRLMDGGRDLWIAEGKELSTDRPVRERSDYPVVTRNDEQYRAFRDDVRAHFGRPLIDVRSPEEYRGDRTSAPDYPEEGALRAGHIPSARSIPWKKAVAEDGTFLPADALRALYLDGAELQTGDEIIAYCRIGERSSHTWFALRFLLGIENVRNYDGSWTEWGSLVGAPVAIGDEPGQAPEARR